jgi:DNA (cytosine-5)-methyltransferase 1
MHSTSDIFSFFSGLGFLDLGFEKQGFNIKFINEYHQPFIDAYIYSRKKLKLNLPKNQLAGSIELILENSIKSNEFDSYVQESKNEKKLIGFIGGPPCPDFSIAGKQKGKAGKNGILSYKYAQLILKKQPDWFLFENVKGLWRTQKHRIFYDEMKSEFEESGYTVSDKLINSITYGVPQDRDRIIMIGFKNGSKISDQEWESSFKFNEDILKKDFWPKTTEYGVTPSMPEKVPENLTVAHWFQLNKVATHPNAKSHFTPRAGLTRFQTVAEGDDSKKSYKRLHRYRYSPTAAYGNNEVHIHPWLPRRISAAEALAIQSLPAKFQLPIEMTLSNMFKGIGNGVPYLMSKGIAKLINEKLIQ